MEQRARSGGRFVPPKVDPTTRRVLIFLGVLTLVQEVLPAMNVSLDPLRWRAFGGGFEPWHPVSFLFAPPHSLFDPLLGMLMVYFLLPALQLRFDDREIARLVVTALAGGVGLALALDAVGPGGGSFAGWSLLLLSLTSAVGMWLPELELRMFGLFPLPTAVVVYGPGAIAAWWAASATWTGGEVLSSAFAMGSWSALYLRWWMETRRATRPPPRPARQVPQLRVLPGGKGVLPGGRDQVHRAPPRRAPA